MKRLVLLLSLALFTINLISCDIEIEFISPNRIEEGSESQRIEENEITKMIEFGNHVAKAEKERRIMGSLGGIFSFGKNLIKPRQQRVRLEEVNPQFFGPLIGSSSVHGKPSFEIEIIKQRPRKNLNVMNKPLPGRAISKLDGAMQHFFDEFTNSIMGGNERHQNTQTNRPQNFTIIEKKNITNENSEFEKLEKRFDQFFDENPSITNTNSTQPPKADIPVSVPTKFVEVSNKKIPVIFHNNTDSATTGDQKTDSKKTEEPVEKKSQEPENSEFSTIMAKIQNSTWYKEMNSKKFVSVSLKYLTYFIFGIIIFLIMYSCLATAAPSKTENQKEKYGVDEIEDELESINKSRGTGHKFY